MMLWFRAVVTGDGDCVKKKNHQHCIHPFAKKNTVYTVPDPREK
jgi:hypothetical protein